MSTRADVIRSAADRGMSPKEIVAATGISKSVVYEVLAGNPVSGNGHVSTAYMCPRDWPADPERYRAGVA